MMLVKSKVLDKSSIHMNVHYSELLAFLKQLTETSMLLLTVQFVFLLVKPGYMVKT